MKKRYSILIKPTSILIDLLILNITMFLISKDLYFELSYLIYINLGWLLISFYTKFYSVYRYTKLTRVVSLLVVQLSVFFLAYFAYFGIFEEGSSIGNQTKTLSIIFSSIVILKLLFVWSLRIYRGFGRNLRNVVVIGGSHSSETITTLFDERSYLGYRYKGYFSDTKTSKEQYLGELSTCLDYILANDIDEIYCSISELSKKDLQKVIDFGEANHKIVKLIPNSQGVFSKGMVLDYYDYIPVLTLKKLPFDDPIIKYSKRFFDIVFSTLVLIFLLSWLSVILFILIKLESKGPLFFKQLREGLNGQQFQCYKYRSMGVNNEADAQQATKGDMRVTRIGKFIRKTSIDELPQFVNVLLGDMSVVGPRPHMVSQTVVHAKKVDKYLIRNLVKPGVTGLAQVRGYRGEIETQADIENRVRMDIFYIKNWSFVLDLKIIFQTVTNALRGEDKAY